jgi:hypothetical protein
MADELSWRLTDRERRQAFTAAVSVASVMLGPLGPLAVWGFDYLYDRRDLIFNTVGTPIRAYTADRSALSLAALSSSIVQPRLPGSTLSRSVPSQSTLTIDTSLTDSARRLGLRNGDPVSVTVTGHRYVQSRSGLVVPTRIGEQVNITVPSGSYSIAAFGSRRASLFSAHDPYSTVAGDNVTAFGPKRLALPLTARAALPSTPASAAVPATSTNSTLAARTCLWCGLPLAPTPLVHLLSCSERPAPTGGAVLDFPVTPRLRQLRANRLPLQQLTFQCDRCDARFPTSPALDEHMQVMHPFITWVRSWLDEW